MEQVVIDIDCNTGSSSDEESECRALVSSLTVELQRLTPLSSKCCIYRTPERLQKQNVQAYTPHLVSIGPYHYNKNEDYANMEVDKLSCLKKFLDRTGVSLDNAVEFMKERETRIRKSYEHNFHLPSNEFVRMVLLDALFVFAFLCNRLEVFRVEDDGVNRGSSSFEEKTLDMLLLENQLPFFIYVDLFELILRKGVLTEAEKNTNIYKLCFNTFKTCINSNNRIDSKGFEHIVDFLRRCLIPPGKLQTMGYYDYKQIVPTATELHKVGVKFKVASSNKSLIDVQFINGVLKFPFIFVNFRTETLFRNILAFEQCHCDQRYITEYIYLMDCLINTPKDVELLVRHKIMVNDLGENEAASALFNNLGKGLTSKSHNNYFGTLFKDLVKYRDSTRHKWVAFLKHDYFNTPWKTLSITAALLLILLTLTQTVISVLSYENYGAPL